MNKLPNMIALAVGLVLSIAGAFFAVAGPAASPVPAAATQRHESGLRKFSPRDFKREPKHQSMTQAQLRALPGYAAGVDDAGNVRTTGKHVIAVVSPNAPPTGAVVSSVQSPALPADGQNYHATSNLPLILPTGPSIHDIHQGGVADCFFLAPLASIAHERPGDVPLQIVREGADLYRSRFRKNSADLWVRGNSALPTNAVSQATGCNWVGVYEKAYAFQRTGADTYASLNFGYGWQTFSDLGYTSVVLAPSAATDAAVAAALSRKWPVVIMTTGVIPAGVPLIGSHCEAVTAFDGTTYSIYNPWGFDGAGGDANPDDGTVALSIPQTRSGGITVFVVCTGYAVPAAFVDPSPVKPVVIGDANGDGKVDYSDFVILSNHFGQVTTRGAADGDFNADGKVDFADYVLLSNHFAAGAGLPAGVFASLSRETVATGADNVTLTWTTVDAVSGWVDGHQIAAGQIAAGSYVFNLGSSQAKSIQLSFTSKDGTPWIGTYTVSLAPPQTQPAVPAIIATIDVYSDGSVKKR